MVAPLQTSDFEETLQPELVFCDPASEYQPFYSKTFASATERELEVLLSISLMSGGAINLSDDLTKLNEAGLNLARKVVSAVSGSAAIPLDLFSNSMPSRWLQKLPHGGRFLLVNFISTAISLTTLLLKIEISQWFSKTMRSIPT